MNAIEISLAIVKEIEGVLRAVDPGEADALAGAMLAARRVFVAGAGRSLLMMRGLAMRLMQLGFQAYVVGETVTPAIEPGDLLVIGSGSGETGTLLVMARKAKAVGASLGLITIYPDSSLGRLADTVVRLPAATTKSAQGPASSSIQPGASSFEQSLLVLVDALVMRVIEIKPITEANAALMKRHANLE